MSLLKQGVISPVKFERRDLRDAMMDRPYEQRCVLAPMMLAPPGRELWHTCAYHASYTSSASTDLAAVPDGILILQNGHFLPQQGMKCISAYGLGSVLARANISSPSLRLVSPMYIRPIIVSATMPTNPNMDKLYLDPPSITAFEELQVNTVTSSAAAGDVTVILNLAVSIDPIPQGGVYRLRCTSTTTVTAFAWSLIAYTLEQQLPAGTYAVLALEYISATAIAARLTFDGQFFRPGMPGLLDDGKRGPDWMYEYQMGVLGTFKTTNLPRIEAFCSAADTSAEVYLHVVRIGP